MIDVTVSGMSIIVLSTAYLLVNPLTVIVPRGHRPRNPPALCGSLTWYKKNAILKNKSNILPNELVAPLKAPPRILAAQRLMVHSHAYGHQDGPFMRYVRPAATAGNCRSAAR